jgi:REP element-mobilizing transposase RayT
MDSFKFIEGVYVYFVTFTVVDWLPIFINPEPINIITDSLNFCIKERSLRVYAYVIMPNHLHLVVFNAKYDNARLQKTLAEFRKFNGHKLADYVDNNLATSLSRVIRSNSLNDRSRQVWLPGWHAEGLASEAFLNQKVDYIHQNPVRKGYVCVPEHWRYSSAKYWLDGEEGEIPISPVIEVSE